MLTRDLLEVVLRGIDPSSEGFSAILFILLILKKDSIMSDKEINYRKYGERITPEEARAFSEGNEQLYKLLMLCIDKNIVTLGCCAGHYFETYQDLIEHRLKTTNLSVEKIKEIYPRKKNGIPYISFTIDDNDANLLNYLVENKLVNTPDIKLTISRYVAPDLYRHNVAFHLQGMKLLDDKEAFAARQNKFFSDISEAIKGYYKQQKTYDSIKMNLDKLLSFSKRISIEYVNNEISLIRTLREEHIVPAEFEKEEKGGFDIYQNTENVKINDVYSDLEKNLQDRGVEQQNS